jgi:hypothetical protein
MTAESGPFAARHAHVLAPAVAGVASTVWLASNAARTITFEDAGALVAAAHVLGVPHPPGYPLWTLLAAGFERLLAPFGVAPAWALALFSALCAGLACGVLARAALAAGVRPVLALAAGLVPPLLPTFASVGTHVEVYALAALFQALLVLFAVGREPRPVLAGLVLGLGLAAHPGTLYLAPLALAPLLRAGPSPRRVGAALAAVGAGLSTYLYVPLRSLADPELDWGDPESAARLADHVLRAQYAVGLERTSQDLAAQSRFLFEQSLGQAPLLFALGIGAAVVLARSRATLWLVGALAFGACASFAALRYPLGRLEPLAAWSAKARLAASFTPLVVLLVPLASLGFEALARRLGSHAPLRRVARLLPALVLAAGLVRGATVLDGSGPARASRGAERWAEDVLSECPEDAVLVLARVGATDVLGFPLLHAQLVEQWRRDVVVIDRELLAAPWYRATLARRAPDLADWLALLPADLAGAADIGARHRAIGARLAQLGDGARTVVFTDPLGSAALGGRQLFAWRTTWRFEPPDDDDGEPSAPWLGDEPTSPWRELHRTLALERDGARADALERAGRTSAAIALRAGAQANAGPPDARAGSAP